jgi:hypothetical protein
LTSFFDYLTLADALTNPQLAFLLLILTFLYSAISFYAILVRLGQGLMQNTEFTPQISFKDEFVAAHTVTIRGVNEKVPVNEANSMIRAIFEERWG